MEFISLIFYILFIFIRPQEWIVELKGFPIVDFIAIFTIILLLVSIASKKKGIPQVPENFLIIGFFIASLLSHVAHTYFSGIIFTAEDIGKLLILYFLIIIIVNSIKKIRVIAWVIIFSAVLNAINGIEQWFFGRGFFGSTPLIYSDGLMRILGVGIFNDPNDLALLFVITVPFILGFIFEKRNLFSKILLFFCGIAITWATWLTNSRTGFLALIIVALVFLRVRFRWVKWVLWSGIFAIIFLNFLPSRLKATFFDESSFNRIIFWGEGNRMLRENPIFGVGYKMFGEHAYSRAAHNSFINCYAELGFLGYFFWLGLLYTAILGLWKSSLYAQPERIGDKNSFLLFNSALFASIIGYLFCGLFLSRTYLLPLYILIAMGAKMRYLASGGRYLVGNVLPAAHLRRVFMLAAGSILIFYLSTIFLKKLF